MKPCWNLNVKEPRGSPQLLRSRFYCIVTASIAGAVNDRSCDALLPEADCVSDANANDAAV